MDSGFTCFALRLPVLFCLSLCSFALHIYTAGLFFDTTSELCPDHAPSFSICPITPAQLLLGTCTQTRGSRV
ncbi:hypothetical protein BGW80DRAFT_1357095 [Lactifluus volemus]|nr:hypothetical protein BGW80DRAFT_1357095 [Lactifluus volemus]